MALDKIIIEQLSNKAGYDVDTPHGCERLCLDLQTELGLRDGQGISVNTLKRLTGVLPYSGTPRLSTLDLIAQYLGYTRWKSLYDHLAYTSSAFNWETAYYDLEAQPEETTVDLYWAPDRIVTLRHLGEGQYEVTNQRNSKLRQGDILTISQVALRFPLYVKEVIRGGASLGTYTAAIDQGVEKVRVYPPKKPLE